MYSAFFFAPGGSSPDHLKGPNPDASHLRVGGRYRKEEGEIELDSIQAIASGDFTRELARGVRSGSQARVGS
jgi:hypothetical protein